MLTQSDTIAFTSLPSHVNFLRTHCLYIVASIDNYIIELLDVVTHRLLYLNLFDLLETKFTILNEVFDKEEC